MLYLCLYSIVTYRLRRATRCGKAADSSSPVGVESDVSVGEPLAFCSLEDEGFLGLFFFVLLAFFFLE